MQDSDIDELLARARAMAAVPDSGLIRRIEADGLAVQAGFGSVPGVVRAAPHRAVLPARGLIGRWLAAAGGGPAVAGLACAALAGVWIGVVQPAPVAAVRSGLSAVLGQAEALDYVEVMPGLDLLATEG